MEQDKKNPEQHIIPKNIKTNRIQFNHEQRISWLQLSRSLNVGPVTFRKLINKMFDAQNAIQSLDELRKIDRKYQKIKIFPKEKAIEEIENARKKQIEYICLGEYGYPPLLENIVSPPPVIAFKGNKNVFNKPCITIVGSRRASAAAIRFTEIISGELAEAGFTIVSGMARGIDSTAHEASVDKSTVAVLAGGADNVYPQENLELYQKIAKKGAIISEMPLGFQPKAQHFPRRNRIIAGISVATIVIEATLNSGSLITANYALEHNREVFAVPHFPLDPRAKGVNKLIMEGATPVTNTQDIIDNLQDIIDKQNLFDGFSIYDSQQKTDKNQSDLFLDQENINHLPQLQSTQEEEIQEESTQEEEIQEELTQEQKQYENGQCDDISPVEKIKTLIGTTPVKVDFIIRNSGLAANIVNSILTELVIKGEIQNDERKTYVKI